MAGTFRETAAGARFGGPGAHESRALYCSDSGLAGSLTCGDFAFPGLRASANTVDATKSRQQISAGRRNDAERLL